MSPLCYIAFIKWSFDDESMSLTASGMKLLYSLVVCQQILGYLLSACSRVDRLWLSGCSFSVYFGLCADITLYWCHWCSVDGSPVILWVQDLSRKAGNWVERLTNLPLAAQSLAGKSFSFLSFYMYFSFQQMKDPPRFQRHSKLYCCDCLIVTNQNIFFMSCWVFTKPELPYQGCNVTPEHRTLPSHSTKYYLYIRHLNGITKIRCKGKLSSTRKYWKDWCLGKLPAFHY